MTELKRLTYQLEDTFALGKTLPVVAMRQLPKLADKLAALPDCAEYPPGIQVVMSRNVMEFYDANISDIDDERELKEIFIRACKSEFYSHHFLRLFTALQSFKS